MKKNRHGKLEKIGKNWNSIMKLLICLLIVTICGTAYADSPIGWAVVDSLEQNGTTGGGNGESVIVNTRTHLRHHAAREEPLTIYIEGMLVGSGNVKVASNKSIIGLGDDATLVRFGFDIDGQENIIIRNLTIKDVQDSDDAIMIKNSHHIWIDHCDLSRAKDGLLDLTKGSDFITVSWTKFSDHDKCSLLNSGTNEFVDYGKCRVTYYRNWYDNTVQRNPRVGYGMAHVFNNYYSNIKSYAIGVHTRAKVLAENNYFLNTNNPIHQMYSNNEWDGNYGDIESVGNIFESSRGGMTGTGKSFDPNVYYDYSFALVDAAIVPLEAKDKVGPGVEYAQVVIPVPGNGVINIATAAPELTWVDTRKVESWDVYFGTYNELSFQAHVTEPVFSPGNLLPDTVYYWRVDAVTADQTVQGPVWRFRTAPNQASKLFPQNGETVMLYYPENFNTTKPLELEWAAGFGADAYDVYLGTSLNLGADDYLGRTVDSVFAPGRLQLGQTYYWRVDSILVDNTAVTGSTWSFTLPVIYIGPGRTEAEDMILGGRYFKEFYPGGSGLTASNGWMVKIESGPGTLSAIWNDSDAICDIDLAYQDQSAGSGAIALYINDDLVDSWIADLNNNQMVIRRISDVQLHTGDEIRIEASSDLDMLTRIDYIDITVK